MYIQTKTYIQNKEENTMEQLANFAGDTLAACSLVFMLGLALGAWLGYTKKGDIDEKS